MEAPQPQRSSNPRSDAAPPETFAIDRERLAALEADGALTSVSEESITCGEDARQLLEEAIGAGALRAPASLRVLVESEDDEEGSWIRLALSSEGPGGLELSKGWGSASAAVSAGTLGALQYAAAELNAVLAVVDPRAGASPGALVARERPAGDAPAALACYRYAGETVAVDAALAQKQLREIERLLGYPRFWLGRHKPGAKGYVFEPPGPSAARALCRYLRERSLAHEHEIAHRFDREASAPAREHGEVSP